MRAPLLAASRRLQQYGGNTTEHKMGMSDLPATTVPTTAAAIEPAISATPVTTGPAAAVGAEKPGGIGGASAGARAAPEPAAVGASASGGEPALDDPATRPSVMLNPAPKRPLSGHPWIFSNEVQMDAAARGLAPGSLVTLRRADGPPLGVAMFNPHSLLAARLLDRDAGQPIGRRFLARRIERALRLRERLYDEPFYRLVHAESDGLPGLVVDRFGDVLVMQANTAGSDRLEPNVLGALAEVVSPRAIVLRNDSPARAQEGLAAEIRVAAGAVETPVLVHENGCLYAADPLAGQKTGWFFDQRENRAFVAAMARGGARVLDLYCYTGGFALQAAKGGAAAVVGIDGSAPALALAEASARLNRVAALCRFYRGEAFAEAERLAAAGERFDIVIADPPAFAKSRREIGPALRGYRKLVRLAALCTTRNGFLFVASCSHNVAEADFADAVRRGLADAGRSGRIIRSAGAGPDHPVHPALPETSYLKSMTLSLD
jgi:23S rRNA (cytosine1962-C5)-methyltransferase